MRTIFILLLLIGSLKVSSQKTEKWQLSIQLQPELTFYKNQYSFRWGPTKTQNSFNIGIASLVQYNFANRVFLEAGVGYISRKLNCKVFVNHHLYPEPYGTNNQLLYITNTVSQRIIFLPIGFGIYFLKLNKATAFVKGDFISNFLLNAKYESRYPGFKKNYWLGYSISPALGVDYKVGTRTVLTTSISYSVINEVAKDPYLFSQDENQISLPQKFVQLSIGIKMNFH
jgi:hypothetical protein